MLNATLAAAQTQDHLVAKLSQLTRCNLGRTIISQQHDLPAFYDLGIVCHAKIQLPFFGDPYLNM